MLVTAVILAGCTSDDPDQADDRTTTTQLEVTTSTSSSTTADPPSEKRGNCAQRDVTKNSPATFDSGDRTYATYLTDFDARASSLSFDIVQQLVGDDADEAYRTVYPDESEAPNGAFTVNENDRVRSAVVRPDADVWLVRLRTDGDAGITRGTLGELPSYLANDDPDITLYWVTFESGQVVEICEQYHP